MTCLHISIEHKGRQRFCMKCDNLKREDATDPEIAMANMYEQAINKAMLESAEKIISSKFEQNGAGAKK